jgi:hypothetical protein
VDVTFAVVLYAILLAIAIPAYLLVDNRRSRGRSKDASTERGARTKKRRGEKAKTVPEEEVLTEKATAAVAPPPVQLLDTSPVVQTVAASEPKPFASSNFRLEGVAKGIGMDVESLKRWVEEKRQRSTLEDRRQAMYRILASLEKSEEERKQRLGAAA